MYFFTEEDEKAETLMDDDIKSLVSEATDQVSREIFSKISLDYFFFIYQKLTFHQISQDLELDKAEKKPSHRKMTADSIPFDKFLDFMEIF